MSPAAGVLSLLEEDQWNRRRFLERLMPPNPTSYALKTVNSAFPLCGPQPPLDYSTHMLKRHPSRAEVQMSVNEQHYLRGYTSQSRYIALSSPAKPVSRIHTSHAPPGVPRTNQWHSYKPSVGSQRYAPCAFCPPWPCSNPRRRQGFNLARLGTINRT